MRALSNLINLNQPDLVLFVGEALVGNDAGEEVLGVCSIAGWVGFQWRHPASEHPADQPHGPPPIPALCRNNRPADQLQPDPVSHACVLLPSRPAQPIPGFH